MFKEFEKLREERKSRKLAALGFVLGAAITSEAKDADVDDVVLGGIAGLFIAGLCECIAPKTTKILKELL
jgi:hypothetical protein